MTQSNKNPVPINAPRSTEKSIISIPRSLVERIERRLKNSDFSSVDEYASYVLDQVLTEIENNLDETKPKPENVFSSEDQENVEQRLRDLGYL